jgi:anti-anti-sigma factor
MFATQNAGSMDGARIDLPPSFDFTSSAKFRMPFVQMLNDPTKDRIVLNLSAVNYVDSCGIGTLVAWHKFCEERGKEMVVQNCNDKVLRILKVLSVDRLFRL